MNLEIKYETMCVKLHLFAYPILTSQQHLFRHCINAGEFNEAMLDLLWASAESSLIMDAFALADDDDRAQYRQLLRMHLHA